MNFSIEHLLHYYNYSENDYILLCIKKAIPLLQGNLLQLKEQTRGSMV
jgi:hypothetical protein